ncbi:UMP kinase [Candidatus Uhrbacteria bacterium]|nr:UMP kinase [Candidatus Uhrbacteria bacterium]
MRYSRVLLKLSGEALSGDEEKPIFPYDPETLLRIAKEITQVSNLGVEIAIVMGGGNIFRGANGASKGMDRVAADQFGMLATIQNGIVLHDLLTRVCGRKEARLMSALQARPVAEPYLPKKARHHLDLKRVIILAGGTGNPYCTTDYAAALRACEIKADIVAKATNTDGLYDKDPRHDKSAVFLQHATYKRCLDEELKVMDTEAFALCRNEKMPILVFSVKEPGNIVKALTGDEIGSVVSDQR